MTPQARSVAARLLAVSAVLAGLLGAVLQPTSPAAVRTATVAAPSGTVLLPGTTSRTLVAAVRAAAARAGARAGVAPVATTVLTTGTGPDLAALPAGPAAPLPGVAVDVPPRPVPAPRGSDVSAPTGRAPPAPAAP